MEPPAKLGGPWEQQCIPAAHALKQEGSRAAGCEVADPKSLSCSLPGLNLGHEGRSQKPEPTGNLETFGGEQTQVPSGKSEHELYTLLCVIHSLIHLFSNHLWNIECRHYPRRFITFLILIGIQGRK